MNDSWGISPIDEYQQFLIIEQDLKNISFIKNPAKAVVKFIIENHPEILEYIYPNELVHQYLIEYNPEFIRYIKNPSIVVKCLFHACSFY